MQRIWLGDSPNSQSAILTTCGHRKADDGNGLHEIARTGQLAKLCPIGHVEDANGGIARSRHDLIPFPEKAYACDLSARPLNRPLLFAGIDGPNLHDVIRAARDKPPAVCLPSDREHVACMAFKRSLCRAVGDRVDLRKAIGASGHQPFPVA